MRPHGYFTENHRRRKIIEEKNSPLQPVCSPVTVQDARLRRKKQKEEQETAHNLEVQS